jgi:hypothetical protein
MFNTDYAEIRVTQNMLDKRTIYANKSVIKLFDDTYDNLTNGEGITFKAEYFYNNLPTSIRCYKVKSRGDKQINISGFNKYVEAGDVIGIFKRVDDEQYHNRPEWSIVKLSAWDDDEVDYLKCALVLDGLVKSEERKENETNS